MKTLLQEVSSIAKEAAKSGHGWHTKGAGAIVCANGHCTLAAIMFKRSEPVRKLQAEFDDLIERAKMLENDVVQVAHGGDLFEEYVEQDPKNFDGFPPADWAAADLGIDESLAELVINANDNSLKTLERNLQTERQFCMENAELLSTSEEYQDAKRAVAARKILERTLLKRKVK